MRLACRLIVLPANGMVVLRVSGAAGMGKAGICPAAVANWHTIFILQHNSLDYIYITNSYSITKHTLHSLVLQRSNMLKAGWCYIPIFVRLLLQRLLSLVKRIALSVTARAT
jgi:hypothetical protein